MQDKSEDVDQHQQQQNKKQKNTNPPLSPPSYRHETNSRSIKNNKNKAKSTTENFLKMFPDMKEDILLLILKKGCDNDVIAATNLLQQCRPIHHHGPPPLATSASLVTVSYDRYHPPNHLYLEEREIYHPHCKECQSQQIH